MGDMADLLRDSVDPMDVFDLENDRFCDVPAHRKVVCWNTKDGRIIPVPEMSTVHLRNTKRMLERAAEARDRYYQTMEMFDDFSVTHDYSSVEYLKRSRTYKAICKELRKREAALKEWPVFTPPRDLSFFA